MLGNGCNGACPDCGTALGWQNLAHDGVIHGRDTARGGPYFTIRCPHCHSALLAIAGLARTYRFYRQRQTDQESRLGRIFRLLFGREERSWDFRPDRDTGPRPARPSGRPGESSPSRLDPRLRAPLSELGLGPETTLQELKRRFRKLAKECHPDLFARAEADERALAERRFVRISLAYQQVLGHWQEDASRSRRDPTAGH